MSLGFDPNAVAPPPVITTTPPGPFTDGEQVTVHGSGFTPNAVLGLAECIAGVEPNGHTCDSSSTSTLAATSEVDANAGGLFDQFTADVDGEFTRTITIRNQFQSTDGTVDCLTEPDGCVLLAANRGDFGAERTTLAIVFASGTGGSSGGTKVRALAFTGVGSGTGPLVLAGGAALALGLALLVAVRRRRVSG